MNARGRHSWEAFLWMIIIHVVVGLSLSLFSQNFYMWSQENAFDFVSFSCPYFWLLGEYCLMFSTCQVRFVLLKITLSSDCRLLVVLDSSNHKFVNITLFLLFCWPNILYPRNYAPNSSCIVVCLGLALVYFACIFQGYSPGTEAVWVSVKLPWAPFTNMD